MTTPRPTSPNPGQIWPPENEPATERFRWNAGLQCWDSLAVPVPAAPLPDRSAAPPEPVPSAPQGHWVQFAAALAGDPAINTLVATAAQAAPVLHLMLGVGLGQAAQGDYQTFMAAWSSARAIGLVSPELIESMQAAAVAYDLPENFVEGLVQAPPLPGP